ncbi:calcitonin gene-related peptide type 1 receptor [Ixodes scapularis]
MLLRHPFCYLIFNALLAGGALGQRPSPKKFPGSCRMENQLYVSQATFNQISCARCYKYMANLSFKNGSRLTYCRSGKLCRDCETPTECYVPYGNQSDVEVYDTFKKKLFAERWESCCRAARECCDEMLSEDADATSSPKEGLYCPATWDGWTCYKDTPAGMTVQKPCPFHAYYITEKPQCISFPFLFR